MIHLKYSCENNLALITSGFLDESSAGHVRILLLVLANQITASRFLSPINYLLRSMVDDVELINVAYDRSLEMFKIESLKIYIEEC